MYNLWINKLFPKSRKHLLKHDMRYIIELYSHLANKKKGY